MSSTFVKNVAIVVAGGNLGTFITTSLLSTGKHNVTAITRKENTSQLPLGVRAAYVNYEDQSSIVDALKGQDALIITISFWAPKDIQDRLIKAAADADVPWILPNEWAPDSDHEGLTHDISSLADMPRIRHLITSLGKSSYLAIACGLWYEWCLSTPVLYGIDAAGKKALLYDEGEQKICTSTWAQIGRAVAALLSLPIMHTSAGEQEQCLEHFRNKFVYIASFTVSQKDMLESIYRVTGSKEQDWTITKVPLKQHFQSGFEARQNGDMKKGRTIYSRVFFDDDAGNHEKTKALANALLGLPEEDIDEATRRAIDMQRAAEVKG